MTRRSTPSCRCFSTWEGTLEKSIRSGESGLGECPAGERQQQCSLLQQCRAASQHLLQPKHSGELSVAPGPVGSKQVPKGLQPD